MTAPTVLAARDVLGADLHAGDVVVRALPDGTVDAHRIDHFAEYPGRFVTATGEGPGDGHARIAYDADERWRHTVADTETFHIQQEQ